jgi:hypothetical protein
LTAIISVANVSKDTRRNNHRIGFVSDSPIVQCTERTFGECAATIRVTDEYRSGREVVIRTVR